MFGVNEGLRARVIAYFGEHESELYDLKSFDAILPELSTHVGIDINKDSLEVLLFTRKHREEFKHPSKLVSGHLVSSFYFKLLSENESLERLEKLFGDIEHITHDAADQILIQLLYKEDSLKKRYLQEFGKDRVDIKIYHDFFLMASIIETRYGETITRDYLLNVLKTREIPWMQLLQFYYLVHLESDLKGVSLIPREGKTELEIISNAVAYTMTDHFLSEMTKKRDTYKENLRILEEKQKSPSPRFLRTISLDSIPIAIAYNPEGVLYVLNTESRLARYCFESDSFDAKADSGLSLMSYGSPINDSVMGGIFMHGEDVIVISLGNSVMFDRDLKIVPPDTTALVKAHAAVTALVKAEDARSLLEEKFHTIGVACHENLLYLVQFKAKGEESRIVATDGHLVKAQAYFSADAYAMRTTSSDDKPRIKIHNGEIYLNQGGNISVYNLDLELVDVRILDYLSHVLFSPGKMDFDNRGRLWVMNQFEGEVFPTIKAYSLGSLGVQDGSTALLKQTQRIPRKYEYDTFHPMQDVTGALSLREFAIDRTNNRLAVTNPAKNTIDIYLIE